MRAGNQKRPHQQLVPQLVQTSLLFSSSRLSYSEEPPSSSLTDLSQRATFPTKRLASPLANYTFLYGKKEIHINLETAASFEWFLIALSLYLERLKGLLRT